MTDVVAQPATGLLRQYYELTKPGITQMVVLTTLAGFYLAVPTDIVAFASSTSSWVLFVSLMIGTVLVSAGSCVFNHIIERDEDAKMKRTAARPIPSGIISVSKAAVFGVVLTLVGLALIATVNTLTFLLAIATWVTYVAVYTPLKKKTKLALLIGGIPGALPFAAGWTAVTGTFDVPALIVFSILFFWQLPHFLALSWMYRTDYEVGGFVMEAVDDPNGKTVGHQMIWTSVGMVFSSIALTLVGVTGWLYFGVSLVLGAWLVMESIRFLRIRTTPAARRVLLTSYAVLMGVVVLMFVDKTGTV